MLETVGVGQTIDLSAPSHTPYGIAQCAQLFAQCFAKRLMGTTAREGCCNPLKVTINAIKTAGDELHRMQLAVRMIAGGRHPPWGAARCVRHVILRTSWDAAESCGC